VLQSRTRRQFKREFKSQSDGLVDDIATRVIDWSALLVVLDVVVSLRSQTCYSEVHVSQGLPSSQCIVLLSRGPSTSDQGVHVAGMAVVAVATGTGTSLTQAGGDKEEMRVIHFEEGERCL
jgi:hypothetical protein